MSGVEEPPLFEAPGPPRQPVTLDLDEPSGWRYEPARLMALAQVLRPYLRAGVEPLSLAATVLDADAPYAP